MKMTKQQIIGIIIVILLVGAGSFYGGMRFQQMQRASQFRTQFGNFPGLPNGNQGPSGTQGRTNRNFRPVNGEIVSIDDTSITVKMADGSSKIVLITEASTINKTESGSMSDLAVGVKVNVFGTDNSDGSVTATNVQINPLMQNAPNGAVRQ